MSVNEGSVAEPWGDSKRKDDRETRRRFAQEAAAEAIDKHIRGKLGGQPATETAKRYQALFGKRGGRRKYGNVSTWHDSPLVGLRRYDSKKEAAYAAQLDLEVKAGLIIAWWPQVPLGCGFDNDDGSPCRLVIDFRVLWADGSITYEDVKGMKPTKDWEVKRKSVEQRYGITVRIIK